MPVLGIDCRFGSAYAGLGSFTRGLVPELIKADAVSEYRLFVFSTDEAWLKPLKANPRVQIIEAPFKHYSFAEQAEFPNVIQDAGCDLLFCPHFNVPLFCSVPFVCTVHDLILHAFPNESGFLKKMAYRFVVSQAIRCAKHIVAVSNATAADIKLHYGAGASEKTTTVYPGIPSDFAPASEAKKEEIRTKYRLSQPFLLYIGNCKQHKNVPMLLDAFREAKLPGVELVLVSGGRESGSLRRTEGVRFLSNIPTEEMPALYGAALGCVTATLAEGFCMPLIEAMACKCPVLATNIGPIPEVCGEHAMLVEPRTLAFADGLRRLVTDPTMRDLKRLDAAKKWSEKYSWKTAARSVSTLLESLTKI